jgi:FHA domain
MQTDEALEHSQDEAHNDDTLELPPLDLEAARLAASTVATDTAAAPPLQSRAMIWLKHMEYELDRLESQWREIDAELGERDGRIAELVATNESTAERLRAEQLVSADFREKLTAAEREIDALSQSREQVKSEYEDLSVRFNELTATNDELLTMIQDLELYIDGRKQEWAELNAELDRQQLEVAELRSAVAMKDEEAKHRTSAIASLREALAESKRATAELREREEATAEETAQLRSELVAEHERVRKLTADLEERRETLRLLDRNLQRINILGASLQRIERSTDEGAGDGDEPTTTSNVHYLGGSAQAVPTKMLIGLDGAEALRFPLLKDTVTIGRSSDSDIRLSGRFVSRLHARVVLDAADAVIEDLDSKNGVFVNAQPVARHVLRDGDVISFGGRLHLQYVELDA